jgi:hypothetical protein
MGWVVIHAQVAWIPHLLFFSVVPANIIIGFFIPFFCFFFFLSGCWGAFGLVKYTVCASDVWVGGSAKVVVGMAIVCCMDNYCNYFVNFSMNLVCAEPMIPSACGPSLYLVLSSIERSASGKMLHNKPG